MITTHVPGLAGLLPLKSLRYITNGEGYPEVVFGDHNEEMLKRIADTLGVFPDFAPALSSHHGIKLVVCFEGPNDVAFLTAISRIAHQSDDSIIDLNASADVIVMPLGGSALKDGSITIICKNLELQSTTFMIVIIPMHMHAHVTRLTVVVMDPVQE